MNEEIEKEIGIHGARWEGFHQGYFSDPIVSGVLIGEIIAGIEAAGPSVLVDLGGGTGYLFSELMKRKIAPEIRLVNLDLSLQQLNRIGSGRINTIQASLSEFGREQIASGVDRVLFFMRSALHYFGESGLASVLRHLRAQMNIGEYFVHQTACFTSQRAADCLNTIYAGMGTIKWYPLVSVLIPILEATGWEIIHVTDAPRLRLASDELKERYRLSDNTVRKIREEILRYFGEIEGILEEPPDGFVAYLPYKIFCCRAV